MQLMTTPARQRRSWTLGAVAGRRNKPQNRKWGQSPRPATGSVVVGWGPLPATIAAASGPNGEPLAPLRTGHEVIVQLNNWRRMKRMEVGCYMSYPTQFGVGPATFPSFGCRLQRSKKEIRNPRRRGVATNEGCQREGGDGAAVAGAATAKRRRRSTAACPPAFPVAVNKLGRHTLAIPRLLRENGVVSRLFFQTG